MMPFSSHWLLPEPQNFTPSPEKVLAFFTYLTNAGILISPVAVRLRIASDENIYARNANTGERILIGKRLKDVPVSVLNEIEDLLQTSTEYVLSAQSSVPVRCLPFDVFDNDGAKAEPAWPCELSVTCFSRNRPTQLSESWHEHLRTFLLPVRKAEDVCKQCGAMHTPEGEVQPFFWIEFAFDGVSLASFKDSELPMQPDVLTRIEAIFDTQFFHGRSFD